jgi:hypothetical protein
MAGFKWNEKSTEAAILLSQGYTQKEVAEKTEAGLRTIERWVAAIDFSAEVDRLSLMVDIAGRAARLRMAMRLVRQRVDDEGLIQSEKDILDWLKFAQSETDGIKLDLTALYAAAASLAKGGSNRTPDKGSTGRGKGKPKKDG